VSFQVDDVKREHDRLTGLGGRFTQGPMDTGPVRMAVLDDTCSNLVRLVELKAA
jgi:predicted enzyme related to lactoylglutathione lyase